MADHCSVYALSDPSDNAMRRSCNHTHTERCNQCQSLKQLLIAIRKATNEAHFSSEDEHDEAVYLCKHATDAIIQWKNHQLRSVRQDQARLSALEQLDEQTCLITNDWAMKFIPQRFRESQSDWFGKRGISWHISVVVRRISGCLQSQTFVHILESSNQGSASVILIIEHVLRTLKTENPEMHFAYLRQDNAGCYHSASTLLAVPAIQESSGMKVVSVDFSDPQGGKGPADRMSATLKNHIRYYINEGHDVTTAEEMKIALLSHGGVGSVRVTVVKLLSEQLPLEKAKIPGINKLNNFQFENEGIRVRRAYAIGSGKIIKTEQGENT